MKTIRAPGKSSRARRDAGRPETGERWPQPPRVPGCSPSTRLGLRHGRAERQAAQGLLGGPRGLQSRSAPGMQPPWLRHGPLIPAANEGSVLGGRRRRLHAWNHAGSQGDGFPSVPEHAACPCLHPALPRPPAPACLHPSDALCEAPGQEPVANGRGPHHRSPRPRHRVPQRVIESLTGLGRKGPYRSPRSHPASHCTRLLQAPSRLALTPRMPRAAVGCGGLWGTAPHGCWQLGHRHTGCPAVGAHPAPRGTGMRETLVGPRRGTKRPQCAGPRSCIPTDQTHMGAINLPLLQLPP